MRVWKWGRPDGLRNSPGRDWGRRFLGGDREDPTIDAFVAHLGLFQSTHWSGSVASCSIYQNRPRFAVFGVGPYSFAPWKVVISGLCKVPNFVVVPPMNGRPFTVDVLRRLSLVEVARQQGRLAELKALIQAGYALPAGELQMSLLMVP